MHSPLFWRKRVDSSLLFSWANNILHNMYDLREKYFSFFRLAPPLFLLHYFCRGNIFWAEHKSLYTVKVSSCLIALVTKTLKTLRWANFFQRKKNKQRQKIVISNTLQCPCERFQWTGAGFGHWQEKSDKKVVSEFKISIDRCRLWRLGGTRVK